jgi:hypothetical protein
MEAQSIEKAEPLAASFCIAMRLAEVSTRGVRAAGEHLLHPIDVREGKRIKVTKEG